MFGSILILSSYNDLYDFVYLGQGYISNFTSFVM